jgi:hypothetical protein
VPPKGGGNAPNTLGDRGNPAPEVRGLLRRNPSFAPQGFASAASNVSDASNAYAASNGSNASAVPGLVVGRFKRRTAYRTTNFDSVVRLVAVLLHRVAMSSRGSVVYVNGRKLARYLGLSGVVHPIDLSAIYSLMEKLGFEVVRTSRGVTAVISMDKPVIKEVKAAKSIDEVIMTVKKYLGE